jgi:ribosome-interacting GTPase 1
VKKVCEIIHKKLAQKIAYSLLIGKKARHTLAAPVKIKKAL